MKRIICTLLISAQLIACNNVGVPPDRSSGDTTYMDFEGDPDGNIRVSNRPSSEENGGTVETSPETEDSGSEADDSSSEPLDPGVGGNGGGGNPGGGGRGGASIDLSGLFEGLGDIGNKIGGAVSAGIGEITGENKRKKKEAKKKAREIEGLLNEAEKLKGEITNRAKDLEQSTNATASSEFNGEKETQDTINNRGSEHNKDLEKTKDTLPSLGSDSEPGSNPGQNPSPSGRDPYPTPEKEKVRKTRDFIKSSRDHVRENFAGDDRKVREGILDTADGATDSADESYNNGDNVEGDWKLDLARKLADLAISSTPYLGDLYDIANAINGENFITGEPIPPEEGAIQAASAIASMASGGTLGAIGDVRKAANVLKDIAKRTARNAAKKGGRDSVDPKKEKDIDDRMGNGEKVARNAGGNQSAADFEKSISKMPPGERVATVRVKADQVAKQSGWEKDNGVSRKNDRQVYTDSDGNYWSVDTQHGRFEKFDKRGKHLGEYNIDREFIKDSIVQNRWLIL